MQSRLKQYFANKRLDNVPDIDKVRAANDINVVSQLRISEVGFLPPNRSARYNLTSYYAEDNVIALLTTPDASLMDITKFYATSMDTWFGGHPFETFILNKTYREDIQYPASRVEFFNECKQWTPFLEAVIIDTCNFILTGRRDIHSSILLDLSRSYGETYICHDGDVVMPELNVKQRFEWKDIESLDRQSFFNAWVSRKGGIQDLICSYKIMLGL